jgi:hypothetical protein
MKTTIELPEDLLQQAKVYAAQNRLTLRELVVEGLQKVLESPAPIARDAALQRLRKGFRLGGKPLSRVASHERRKIF